MSRRRLRFGSFRSARRQGILCALPPSAGSCSPQSHSSCKPGGRNGGQSEPFDAVIVNGNRWRQRSANREPPDLRHLLIRSLKSQSMEFLTVLRTIVAAFAFILPCLLIAQSASTPRPAITGISHMALFADDIPKSRQFYAELLGWDQAPLGCRNIGRPLLCQPFAICGAGNSITSRDR